MQHLFERFVGEAQQAFASMAAEAARQQEDAHGTQHLLAGLLRDRHGLTAQVLDELGLDIDPLLARLEASSRGWDAAPAGSVGLTPPMKLVIERSVAQARGHQSRDIYITHVLLGLLDVEDSRPGQSILEYLAVDWQAMRAAVERQMASA